MEKYFDHRQTGMKKVLIIFKRKKSGTLEMKGEQKSQKKLEDFIPLLLPRDYKSK